MRKSLTNRRKEIFITCATKSWKNRGGFLEVATTRPETIMADTAVAVHPNDKRYVDLVGKHAWRPLAREKLPIVADEAIDPEFGTGVLKVTPAHDKLDFEIGQRHKLPIIDVLTPDGRIDCPAVPGAKWTRSLGRAKRRLNYCKIDNCFRRPSRTKTTSASASAAKCRSSRA